MNPGSRLIVVGMGSALLGSLLTLGFLDGGGSRAPGNEAPSDPPVTLSGGAHRRGTLSDSAGRDIVDPRISLRQLAISASLHAMEDPGAAVRRAASIPGHDNREIYLGEVLRVWGETDGKAAAAFANDYFQGRQLSDALYYIADGWAEVDPAGAAAWFRDNTEGSVEDDALWECLESWGRKDPGAALAWANGLDDYVKANAMQGLAEGWGAVDPEGAAEAGMGFVDSEFGRDFLTSVATQWAGSDPDKASAWALGLANERLRAAVVYELVDIWSRSDPQAAGAWAAKIEDPGTRATAEAGIAKGWSIHDPGGAMEWALARITDPPQLEEAINDIFFNWSNFDPRGASRWLDAQSPGKRKDQVLGVFSSIILDQDPDAAVAWANRISDEASRERRLRSILEELVASYGDWAYKAIQGYDIPEPLKREFTPPAE
jgi:hypothetical protein